MDEFTCRECSRLLYDELEQEFGLCNKCAAIGRDSVKDIITGLEDAIIANQVMIQTRDERIAELEAQLAQATTEVERTTVMYFKAEAKLERVREWLELRGYLNEHDCIVLDPTEVGDLERILAKGGE